MLPITIFFFIKGIIILHIFTTLASLTIWTRLWDWTIFLKGRKGNFNATYMYCKITTPTKHVLQYSEDIYTTK